jgi:hypothetical protein
MKKYTKARMVVAQKTNTGINLVIKRLVKLRLADKKNIFTVN